MQPLGMLLGDDDTQLPTAGGGLSYPEMVAAAAAQNRVPQAVLARLIVVSNRVAVPGREAGKQAGGLAVADVQI